MIGLLPAEMTIPEISRYLLGGVTPRPIAFVSTISEHGVNNLSPFSFFNAFGNNPPVVAFSPSRRGRDDTTKDTYNNIMATRECVIHVVTYSIVEQMNLASCEYPENVDEIERAGFTAMESDLVKPKRIKESPYHLECKLMDMVHLGGKAASGNLAICEVVKFHIAEDIMKDGLIDPHALDAVGRNGGAYYTRASGKAVFELQKPGRIKGIGLNALPDFIRNSNVYSGNNLGRFALVNDIPNEQSAISILQEVEPLESTEQAFFRFKRLGDKENMLRSAIYFSEKKHPKAKHFLEQTAKQILESGDQSLAWSVAILAGIVK